MKLKVSKEWCMNMAQLEGDTEIGAGRQAMDPILDEETTLADDSEDESRNIAFGLFVNLMRRRRGISLERLATEADITIEELYEIENDTHYTPVLRTTYQLANYFEIPRSGFIQIAGLTTRKNAQLSHEAVRFAARAEAIAKLTPEENAALEAFVAILSQQK